MSRRVHRMVTRYLEIFDKTRPESEAVVPNLMRHIHARQHLGKAVVLCDDPDAMLALAQKQWLKLSRILQKRRGFETNAVEILKYTYTITQMQHTGFVSGPIHNSPQARVYFERPDHIAWLPMECSSVYLLAEMPKKQVARLISQLPDLSLLVDYSGHVQGDEFGLTLRTELEKNVQEGWKEVEGLLEAKQIDIDKLANVMTSTEGMDDAVDTLLGVDAEFLAVARNFQRQLDLARPLRDTPKVQRDRYEAFILLAHRVQTFSTEGFSPQFLRTYANDTFFLHDPSLPIESFAQALWRHQQAGRMNIAQMMVRAGSESFGRLMGQPALGVELQAR